MVYGNRRNFLNNISLGKKKALVFGFLILLFLVVYGVNQLVFNDLRRIATERSLLMGMLEDLLEARFAAMELRAGKASSASIEEVESNIAELEAARVRVDEVATDPEFHRELTRIIDGAFRYGEMFDAAADAHLELYALVDRVDTESDRLQTRLDSIADAAGATGKSDVLRTALDLEKHLANAKLDGKRHLWRNAPARLDASRQAFAAAIAAADRLVERTGGGLGAEAERLRDQVAAVARTYEEASLLVVERDEIFEAELDVLGPRLVDDLEAIIDARLGAGAATGTGGGDGGLSGMETTMMVATMVAVLFAIAAAWLLVRAIVVPIRALTERIKALADGDTDFQVRAVNSTDEMGTIWSALGRLKEAVAEAYTRSQLIGQLPNPVLVADPHDDFRITYMNEAARALFEDMGSVMPCRPEEMIGQSIDIFHEDPEHVKRILRDPANLPWRTRVNYRGVEHVDLKVAALRDQKGDYVGAMLALRRVTDQVESTYAFETNIKATVDQIASTFNDMRERIEMIANNVADTQGRLSEGTEAAGEATSAVQMVASASEELSSSITEIASRLGESSRRATDAASNTSDVARRAQDLAAVSQRITEVVDTISDIADKTNLLALNATIEAASAGAAGKGFAVVAAEVKNLADQTAKATDEVSKEMSSIQSQIRSVTEGVTAVAQVIEEINAVFASVAAAAEEQQAATREITINAQNAAGGAETAASTIRLATDAATSNMEATRALTSAARELTEANDNLSRETDTFLSKIKQRSA